MLKQLHAHTDQLLSQRVYTLKTPAHSGKPPPEKQSLQWVDTCILKADQSTLQHLRAQRPAATAESCSGTDFKS